MKKLSKLNRLMLCGLFALTALYSCQKANVSSTDTADTKLAVAVASAQAIQLTTSSTSSSLAGTSTDAIYAVNAYPAGGRKDSVTFASLPATIGTYLAANYAGYTVQKTFKIYNAAGVADGYVVVVLFNAKPVALRFDTAGAFVSVLKQCEGNDIGGGPGWHDGGRFGDRDGKHRDTVAILALPTAVKAYFTANYKTDTLLHAALNMDGSYSVISANKALYVTTVSATGTLLSRIQISPRPDSHTAVIESALLPDITTYLTTTFPGYVFDKAFVEKAGTTIVGYDVFVTVNGTRHALLFDATGKFVKGISVR